MKIITCRHLNCNNCSSSSSIRIGPKIGAVYIQTILIKSDVKDETFAMGKRKAEISDVRFMNQESDMGWAKRVGD